MNTDKNNKKNNNNPTEDNRIVVIVCKINNNISTAVYKYTTYKRKFKNDIVKNWLCPEEYANTLIKELENKEHYIDNEGAEYWAFYTSIL